MSRVLVPQALRALASGAADGKERDPGADLSPSAPRETTSVGKDTWRDSADIETLDGSAKDTWPTVKERQMPGTPVAIRGALTSKRKRTLELSRRTSNRFARKCQCSWRQRPHHFYLLYAQILHESSG